MRLGLGLGLGKSRFIKRGSTTSYILDTVTALNAYSLRKLKSTATKAIRVERLNDNVQQDIGFIGYDLDEDSLLSFVGDNIGVVVTLYDQYGSDNYTALSSVAPKVVGGGVVVKEGLKATMDFYYSGQKTMNITKTIPQPFVGNTISTAFELGNRQIIRNSADYNWRYGYDSTGANWLASAGLSLNHTQPLDLNQTLVSIYFNGANSFINVNQVQVTGNSGTNSAVDPTLGINWRGKIAEHIILPDDSQLAILEADQQGYYSTPF